jgi:hypothetical protein
MRMLVPADVRCPYCGEDIAILLDPSTDGQEYVEDCQVCCRPIAVRVDLDDDGMPHASLGREDEG